MRSEAWLSTVASKLTPNSSAHCSARRGSNRVRGDEFDIDILVVLGSFTGWVPSGGITPDAALRGLYGMVCNSNRYRSMRPVADDPTVKFEYEDGIEVELVPAYLDMIGHSPDGTAHYPTGRAYWIPKDGDWKLADYNHDATYITRQNAIARDWLVPTIKMLKSLRREYFPQLSAFHLEIIAALIIPTEVLLQDIVRLPVTYPHLMTAFFEKAGKFLAAPITAPGSLSQPVELNPTDKLVVTTALTKLHTICTRAGILPTESKQYEIWKRLFGDVFPAPYSYA